jgi:thiamine-monophosphate kinase
MFDEPEITKLEDIGEFGLIKQLTQHIELKNNTIKGVGDDAAVINPTKDKLTLVSTDMLLEGIHFDLSYFPLKHLGFKAVSVNASDIYAMNGIPKQITVSLGISSKFSVEAIQEIYDGISVACEKYKIDLVGGDTTSSKQGLVISVTIIGEATEKEVVYRNGAKEFDLICVTGDLGGAYAGFQLLEREKRVFIDNPQMQPDLSGHDYILERQLKPEARKDIVELFKAMEIVPTAMIDVSDGLASELFHIAEQSKVGITIYEEKIPIDATTYNMARELDLDPTLTALSGGEDYELLFTIKQSDYNKIENHPDFTVIGHITKAEEGVHMISKGGNKHELKAQGWKAF